MRDLGIKRVLLVLLLLILAVSCGKRDLRQKLENMIGKQVCFPDFNEAVLEGRDTTMMIPTDSCVRMVIFHDPTGCNSCNAIKLYEWDNVLQFADESNGAFVPVFIFTPSDEEQHSLTITLKSLRLKFPAYIDSKQEFIEKNTFILNDARFYVFLLDRDNKVLLVGNPLNNPDLWQLYQSTILEQIRL